MNCLEIAKAEQNDLKEILVLQYLAYQSEAALCGTQDIPPLKQTPEELLAEYDRGLVLKLVEGNRIIGSVRARCEEDSVYIGKLMVHPDYQRRGLGRRLLTEVEKRFPGYRYELFTSIMSANNLKLYESLGYREFKQKTINDHVTLIYLEKK